MRIELSEKQISTLRVACFTLADRLEILASQTKDEELVGLYNEQRAECQFLADFLRKKRSEWFSSWVNGKG